MGADTIYLPRAVPPGETIDLSLQMIAPDIEEDYSNFWRLRNTAGEIFGTTFYVAIEVSKGAGESHPHRNADFGNTYPLGASSSDAEGDTLYDDRVICWGILYI